ncbi:MAG: hypothetical protein ACRYFX_09480 [Janthinobacterium lividum]
MLLTTIAFNLKKLLKHQPSKILRLASALPVPPLKGQFLRYWRGRYCRHTRLGNGKQGEAGVLQQLLRLTALFT